MEKATKYGGHSLLPPPSAAAGSGAITALSMDEAWRAICLSPTSTTSAAVAASHGGNRATFLQEFLQSNHQRRRYGGRHSCLDEVDTATMLRLSSMGPHEEEQEFSWIPKASILPRKRVHEVDDDDKSGHDHGRKKLRLIKNRESAAKARARKQAYMDELEARIKRLKKENAELRKQCVEAASECPKKHTLSRTLTAPF